MPNGNEKYSAWFLRETYFSFDMKNYKFLNAIHFYP